MARVQSYYQESLDAIAGFEAARSEADLGRTFSAAISRFGYHSYCMVAGAGAERKFSDKLLLVSWPQGWFEHYIENGYHPHDPIAACTRSSVDAFRWKDAPIPDDPRAQEVMDVAAEDFGLRRGFCIPVHALSGYQAGISIAGDKVEESSDSLAALELLAMYAFMRLTRLRAPQRSLTSREREVVTWIAAGKSAWDTGGILNIAEDTVNKHIKSAMRKLDVHTRAQAVAESIRRGEIAL